MKQVFWLFIALLWVPQIAVAGMPAYIDQKFQQAITTWLVAHPSYRLAVDDDCKCKEDIEAQGPNTHPFFVSGDFDGDGISDFAVMALPDRSHRRLFRLKGRLQPRRV